MASARKNDQPRLTAPWLWACARLYVRAERQRRDPVSAATIQVTVLMASHVTVASVVAIPWFKHLPHVPIEPRIVGLGIGVLIYVWNDRRFRVRGAARGMIRQVKDQRRTESLRDQRRFCRFMVASFLAPFIAVVAVLALVKR